MRAGRVLGWVTAGIIAGGIPASACRIRTSGVIDSLPPAPRCTSAVPTDPRAIVALVPSSAPANGTFFVQPGGESAVVVTGTGFTTRDKVYWNGTRLATTYGSPTLLTALVPQRLLTRAGEFIVSVRDPVFARVAEVRATFRVVAGS